MIDFRLSDTGACLTAIPIGGEKLKRRTEEIRQKFRAQFSSDGSSE